MVVGVGAGVGVNVGLLGVLAWVWQFWLCDAARTWAGSDGFADVLCSAPFEVCGLVGQ